MILWHNPILYIILYQVPFTLVHVTLPRYCVLCMYELYKGFSLCACVRVLFKVEGIQLIFMMFLPFPVCMVFCGGYRLRLVARSLRQPEALLNHSSYKQYCSLLVLYCDVVFLGDIHKLYVWSKHATIRTRIRINFHNLISRPNQS